MTAGEALGPDPEPAQDPAPDAVLRALAEPQRRRILQLVRGGELPAGEIADQFAITNQAVSQHLRVLKDAGLLRERREGTRRLYALRPEAIDAVRDFLDELWPSSLADLKAAVERDRAPGDGGAG
ncbi:MAG TPA: metalloregulator ArsR/SmtB family transcription factor [Acidimicrobiales bacterium]|nr:metalloregulator ArsR/SmtB family transcription factor [Acidimicrobiales bacterium]